MINLRVCGIFSILFLLGCFAEQTEEGKINFDSEMGSGSSIKDELTIDISNDLSSWNLNNGVHINSNTDTINIEISYLDKDSFYLDVFTNELIVKTILYKYRKDLENYKMVNVYINFEGYPDLATFNIDESKKVLINEFFVEKKYYENVIYSLENFNYEDIATFNSIIKFIVNEVNRYNFSGNYWELLKEYTGYYSPNNGCSTIEAELFVTMVQMIKHVGYNNLLPKDIYEKFTLLLESQSLEIKVLDMNADDTQKYIESFCR